MIFIILYGLIVLSFSIAPCAQELVSIGVSPCCWRWFLWRNAHWVLGRLSAAVPTSPDQFGKPRCIQVLLKLSKTSTVETHNLLIISYTSFTQWMPGWVRPKQFQCIAHFVNPRRLWPDPRMHSPSCWLTSGRSDQIVQLEHWPPTAMAGQPGPGLRFVVRHPALY
jgi:hypothetical protein